MAFCIINTSSCLKRQDINFTRFIMGTIGIILIITVLIGVIIGIIAWLIEDKGDGGFIGCGINSLLEGIGCLYMIIPGLIIIIIIAIIMYCCS